MPRSPVLWSAQACPFRRAGVYFGLSEADTHVRVAQRLLPRRGTPYPPGTVQVRPGHSVPLVYIAVRDPSAVRVVPVRETRPSDDDRDHVSLVFPPDPRASPQTQVESLQELRSAVDQQQQAGFIVTVGLRADREAEFHRRVIKANPNLAYSQLCDLIEGLADEFVD